MTGLLGELNIGTWGLARARTTARVIERSPKAVRALVRILFGSDAEACKRAADVARRITDHHPTRFSPTPIKSPAFLHRSTQPSSQPAGTSAWSYPGSPVPIRNAFAPPVSCSFLAGDQGKAVRCSVEGFATLAAVEVSLLPDAEEMIEQFLRSGTTAMKCRARYALRLLQRGR